MHYPPTNAPLPCQSAKNVLRGIAAANVEIEKTAVSHSHYDPQLL